MFLVCKFRNDLTKVRRRNETNQGWGVGLGEYGNSNGLSPRHFQEAPVAAAVVLYEGASSMVVDPGKEKEKAAGRAAEVELKEKKPRRERLPVVPENITTTSDAQPVESLAVVAEASITLVSSVNEKAAPPFDMQAEARITLNSADEASRNEKQPSLHEQAADVNSNVRVRDHEMQPIK